MTSVPDYGGGPLELPDSVQADRAPTALIEGGGLAPYSAVWNGPVAMPRTYSLRYDLRSVDEVRGIQQHFDRYRLGGTFLLRLPARTAFYAGYAEPPRVEWRDRVRGSVTVRVQEATARDFET